MKTGGAEIPANDQVVLEVQNIMTPPSERVAGVAEIRTYFGNGNLIDGPTNVVTDAITAGVLTCAAGWRSYENTPGVATDVRVNCTTTGKIQPGGRIVLRLPPYTWRMPEKPVISFLNPSAIESFSSWNATSSELVVTLKSTSSIDAAQQMVFSVAGVRTPDSVRDAAPATIQTEQSDSK